MADVTQPIGRAELTVERAPRAVRLPLSAPVFAAVAASSSAGILHYGAAVTHRPEATLEAVLFTALGAFQVVWPVGVRSASWSRVLAVGAAVNLVAAILWAVSRTTGLPFGHHSGEAEAVGPLDAVTVAAEILVVVMVGLVWWRSRAGRAGG